MMNKLKAAFATGVIFVLIGIGILGAVLFLKNLPAIISEFVGTPQESIAIYISGAISLKIAQILRLCRARKIRAKKAERARKKAAITAKAKAQAEAKAEPEDEEQ